MADDTYRDMTDEEPLKKLQWHAAFQAALQIELLEDEEALQYYVEYNLTKKPLQIDIVVVKPDQDIAVKKSIGKIFRKYNIIEFKSPDDYISFNDFHHVIAYTCLYQSRTDKVHEIRPDELTISFVCYHYPKKMLRRLKDYYHIAIEEIAPGIYYVYNLMFPVQIILVNRLPDEEYTWLSRLRGGLSVQKDMEPLAAAYRGKEKHPLFDAVMDIIIRANPETYKEGQEMCQALRELFADEIMASEKLGGEKMLLHLINKKQKKGKPIEMIADELEVTVQMVSQLLESRLYLS